jgi:hypothetical protein
LWVHVEDLGYARSSRALKRLRINGLNLPCGTTFSNRLIETKLSPERPVLLDYNTAHDLVSLISYRRQRGGKSVLQPASELVRFDCRVVGLSSILGAAVSEHTDPIGDLALRAGLPAEAILQAIDGRLLPRQACMWIVAAAGAVNGIGVQQHAHGKKATPCNDTDVLRTVLERLAA